ncbi:hypothetical protein AND_010195 [Anopheles darlingi]|uniref:Uncharacterized protein n=1 Tax=Anopheles darlingi TaxID=43151 RepID=W5J321_ANODA|nr:uncharacterized protein LOC125957260 [Anopheles darlingi]ETN58231.1 hypothetical protein AND_010195 [Anopheles darlingi]
MACGAAGDSLQHIIAAYGAVVNKISVARFGVFEPFFNDAEDMKTLVEEFRRELLDAFTKKISKLWNEADIERNLEILELLRRNKNATDSVAQWRPTGKFASEQIRPLIVNKLNWSLKFYQYQLAFQQERTEELIVAIEGNRQKYKAIVAERAHKMQQMANEQEAYGKDQSKLRALNTALRKTVE